MPEVIRLGPLSLQAGMLALIAGFAVGLFAIRYWIRRTTWANSPITDIIVNSGIVVLLVWKFGPVLLSPSLLWNNPLKLLMLTGSWVEVAIGLLIAFIYSCFQLRKHQIPFRLMLDLVAFGGTAASIVYYGLVVQYGKPTDLPWGIGIEGTEALFHPVNQYFAVLLIPMLVYMLLSPHKPGEGRVFKEFAFYYGITGMIATFFSVIKPVIIYISPLQLLYLAIIILGMLLPNNTHNRNRKELIELAKGEPREQIQHKKENEAIRENQLDTNKDGNFDKKLDGPNRPAE